MKWEEVKLGDIAVNIQTGPFGSQLHQSDYSIDGVPVVMPKDLIGGKVIEDSIARVEEYHINRLRRHKLNECNIIYARRGDVGKCSYITKIEEGWLCGTGCLKVELDENQVVPKFVFYQLQKSETVGWIEKHAIGATMLNLNTSILSSVPVSVPTLKIQQSIVSILSAYDDLIENNQKQIKLLEEAAQRLYKEWFVDLRYPRHENVEFVDGLPKGWSRAKLSELGTVITGKTPSTSNEEFYGNDVPFVKIPDMHNKIFPLNVETYLSEEGANSEKGKYLPPNTLLISCIGTAGLINITVEKCQTNQQINALVLINGKILYYIYYYLKGLQELLQGLGSNGATMTNVNKKKLESILIEIPRYDLVENFFDYCKPVFDKILMLSKENISLQEARDRLLQRLMSGEVEV